MFIVIFFSIIALFLTFLESRGQMKGGMKWGFIIVTILAAIHYDYGNDYMSYMRIYDEVVSDSFNLKAILAGDVYREPGWALLCWLFKPIGGFFMMVAVINVIQNCIVYQFIKKNVELKWWPLSMFIYLFSTSFYLLSFTMMRQMFVMVLFLSMWKNIVEKKWWIPLIILYLCSYVHSSAIVLLPFAFWGFVPLRKIRFIAVVYSVLLVTLFLLKDILQYLLSLFVLMDESFLEYSEIYKNDEKGTIGIGFLISMIPFVLSIIYLMSQNKKSTNQKKSVVALCAISSLISPFLQLIPLISRIGMYFGLFSLSSIPIVYNNITYRAFRVVLLSLYILLTLYSYYFFFADSAFSASYSTYHTIFSAF